MEEKEEVPGSLVFKQFVKLSDPLAGKKSKEFQCLHCQHKFSAASETKLRHHLLGTSVDVKSCKSKSPALHDVKGALKKLQQEKADAAAAKQRTVAAQAVAGGSNKRPAVGQPSQLPRFNPITAAYNKADR
jgi:hypothetical protein